MYITVLLPDMALKHINDLTDIEQYYINTKGNIYSTECWEKDNFLVDLPGKWNYSMVAIEDEKIVGYWITTKFMQGVHSNRVAVLPHFPGLGSLLYEEWEKNLIDNGVPWITLITSSLNSRMKKFCVRKGFSVLDENTLKKFIALKKINAHCFSTYFETQDKNRYVVLGKRLNTD